jgi:carboxyl-terminal processing protease
LSGGEIDAGLRKQIFEAIWSEVPNVFYDASLRGLDWNLIRTQFEHRALRAQKLDTFLDTLRAMLRNLRNSHVFLHSRDEWNLSRYTLPFFFEQKREGVFVTASLRTKLDIPKLLNFGDRIESVDGRPARRLRPLTLARLESFRGNPYLGSPDTSAELLVKRTGPKLQVKLSRHARRTGFRSLTLQHHGAVACLRFLTMGSDEIPLTELQETWKEAMSSRGIVLDLRNCLGGDPSISDYLVSSLLGAGKSLFRVIPRPEFGPEQQSRSTDVPRYDGKVALIINANTESQPEVLSALCKEYGRAKLFGSRTAGAFHGWTKAINLPSDQILFALPYTRHLSPSGRDYEGVGVWSDVPCRNTQADYLRRVDVPLQRAIEYASG